MRSNKPIKVRSTTVKVVSQSHRTHQLTCHHVVRGLPRQSLTATSAVKRHVRMRRVKDVPYQRLIAMSTIKTPRHQGVQGGYHVAAVGRRSLSFIALADGGRQWSIA